MKFRLVSDIHYDILDSRYNSVTRVFVLNDIIPPMNTDKDSCLLLAGDTMFPDDEILNGLRERFKHVFCINGNHEYYGREFFETENTKSSGNIHWMNYKNSPYHTNDFVLWADTLWSEIYPQNYMAAMKIMNDYRYIKIKNDSGKNVPFRPAFSNKRHFIAKESLVKFLNTTYDVPKIVMTHHGPSYRSVAEKYKGDPINCCYVSDLEKEILNSDVHTWVHGHTHEHKDYKIGDTRILVNPYGYYQMEQAGFDTNLSFDV